MEHFTIEELNDIYYCLGRVKRDNDIKLIDNKQIDKIMDKIFSILEKDSPMT